MPRNEAKPLSAAEHMTQRVNANVLHDAMVHEATVTVAYVKRNGTVSSSSGTVKFFNGKPGFDTGSVTIADPVKGSRTINLHRITKVE